MPARRSLDLVLITILIGAGAVRADQPLVSFEKDWHLESVIMNDARASLSDPALRVETGHEDDWAGIVLPAPDGRWDLSDFGYVTVDLKNIGSNEVAVTCRIENPNALGTRYRASQTIELAPGSRGTLRIPLPRRLPKELRDKLFGMRGFPGGDALLGLDPANVNRLRIFVDNPVENHCFEIGLIQAGGVPPTRPSFPDGKPFPLIDALGQYLHGDWPGKTKSLDDLAARKKEEAADLAAHPGPDDWDQYGGWKTGPQLSATGFFRVEKHEGKWWLVDPEGRLFWSHGIDCVRSRDGTTPITDRKHWFADLPAPDSAFGQFYDTSNYAPHNYYEGRTYETYNFTAANLLRKYGESWPEEFGLLSHWRLRSWGINTIANWSDSAIYLMRKTPYTSTFNITGNRLGGSAGYWRKFVDVFDPDFAASARRQMAEHKNRSAGDPWCIGFFIDNEESWDLPESLAIATLRSPPDQPAKRVFVDDLKAKYQMIERLNEAWATQHASWDALLQSTTPPRKEKAQGDLEAFSAKTAERYFEVCRDTIKQAAPNQLYLGCRFSVSNDLAVRAAAKYCDVVSFNWYKHSAANLRLPKGVDKPIIIGEFHFGALDRGMFHPGLVATASQNDRAEAYRHYVRSALQNPWIVGAHWFQYGDQTTVGRSDGENYQIGFLDVCDTPYVETIEASRDVARDMYQCRSGK